MNAAIYVLSETLKGDEMLKLYLVIYVANQIAFVSEPMMPFDCMKNQFNFTSAIALKMKKDPLFLTTIDHLATAKAECVSTRTKRNLNVTYRVY